MKKIIVVCGIILSHTIAPACGEDLKILSFHVIGNQTVPQKELDPVLEPYLKSDLTWDNLSQAIAALNKYYQSRGYLAAIAIFPRQKIKDGKVTIEIKEGKIQEIQIEGNRQISSNWIKAYIGTDTLIESKLTAQIQLLRQQPLIADIRANLIPTAPGSAILKLQISEVKPKYVKVSLNNYNSPATGIWEGAVTYTNLSLIGRGDIAIAKIGKSSGSTNFQGFYQLPVNRRGNAIQIGISHSQNQIVEDPISILDLQSSSTSAFLTWQQPIVKDVNRELLWKSSVDWSSSQTYLDGQPFPFSNTADDSGRTEIWALRTGVQWTSRNSQNATSIASQLSWGRGNGTEEFVKWNNDLLYFQKIGDLTGKIGFSSQIASDNIFPEEAIAVGGMGTVRGYRYREFLGDNGIFGNLELEIPLQQNLAIAPFVDVARVWGRGYGRTLSSTGISLNWKPSSNTNVRIDLAAPLSPTADAERLLFSIEQSF